MAAAILVAFWIIFVRLIVVKDVNKTQPMIQILVMVALVLTLLIIASKNVAPILFVLVATQLPRRLERMQAIGFLIIVNLAFYIISSIYNEQSMFFSVITYFLLQIYAFSTIEISHREEKARTELSLLNQELIATRFLLKETSRRQERIRISRDLHDVVGHQLTALSLNLEVSCHKVPGEHKPMLEQNLSLAKKLLHDVRNVVKEMREEEQFDLTDALDALFEQLPNCKLTILNAPKINSLSLKHQLVYSLQEGISNGLRHGRAEEFELDCQSNGNTVKIMLQDNGFGCGNIQEGSGLTGMRERLSEFGGEVSLTSNKKGCLLSITVEDNYD